MKKGQVAIFILVGLFFVAVLALYAWLKLDSSSTVEEKECSVNSDCVPKECCDSDLCVPFDEAPECGQSTPAIYTDDSWYFCSRGCDSFGGKFLGCMTNPGGPGSCQCVNEQCAPVWP